MDEDFEETDDAPSAPSVVATDVADLAACDEYTPKAWIAPDGKLLEHPSSREIVLRDIADDIDELLIFCKDPTAAQRATIDWLAAAATEKHSFAILLVRIGEEVRPQPSTGALEVPVSAQAWDTVVRLAPVLLEGAVAAVTRAHRRRRVSPTSLHMRWLRMDPRPAPMIASIRAALTGKRVFVGARLPTSAEGSHTRGDVEPWTAGDQLVFLGQDGHAEVLLIEEVRGTAPRSVLREPELIAHDSRPYRGELAFITDIETCARRIASLHLVHQNALTTQVLVEQCASSATSNSETLSTHHREMDAFMSPVMTEALEALKTDERRRLFLGTVVNYFLQQQVVDLVTHE